MYFEDEVRYNDYYGNKKDNYIDWSLGVKIWIYMTFLNN